MRILDKIRLRLRSLVRRGYVERELGEEFRFHLDQLTGENIGAGMSVTHNEDQDAALRGAPWGPPS